jgi:hypothetical protein
MTALLSLDGSVGIKKVPWVLNLLRDERGYPRPWNSEKLVDFSMLPSMWQRLLNSTAVPENL